MRNVLTHWLDELSISDSLRILKDLALRECRESGPYGQPLSELISSEKWEAICDYDLSYAGDIPVEALIHLRQALGFLTKLEDLNIGVDKELVGFRKFQEAEDLCGQTNRWFKALREGSIFASQRDTLILSRMRKIIRKVLGRSPSIASLKLHFGPGATTSIRKTEACPTMKMAEAVTCSNEMYAYASLDEVLRACPHWLHSQECTYGIDEENTLYADIDVVIDTGRLQFVPKSAKTYRCIDTQPTANTVLQLGIGNRMYEKLIAAGLDLSSTAKNHRLAKEGSINNSLATIDLSSASDCMSYELVKYLLPDDWFRLLVSCRAGCTSYKGDRIVLSKFSGMGNGYTFPLESLIFWSITTACCWSGNGVDMTRIATYGDDIICPSEFYDEVVRMLTFCGFIINTDKSYADGFFRESCGCDYYKGINIRPYYQKHLVSSATLFTLHNFYIKHFDVEAATYVKKLIPTSVRLYGPSGYGDGHLHSDVWNPVRAKATAKKGYGGRFFESYTRVGKSLRTPFPGDWISPLYSIYVSNGVPVIPFSDQRYDAGVTERDAIRFTKGGRPYWPTPGVERGQYEKRMIYTLG